MVPPTLQTCLLGASASCLQRTRSRYILLLSAPSNSSWFGSNCRWNCSHRHICTWLLSHKSPRACLNPRLRRWSRGCFYSPSIQTSALLFSCVFSYSRVLLYLWVFVCTNSKSHFLVYWNIQFVLNDKILSRTDRTSQGLRGSWHRKRRWSLQPVWVFTSQLPAFHQVFHPTQLL